MINENFVYLAVVLNLIGGSSYLIDTWKGKTKPNRVTWFLWGAIPLIAYFAQRQEGVGLVSLMTLGIAIIPFLVFFVTFITHKGIWQLTKFDYLCGAISVTGVTLWLWINDGNLAIAFSILADATASTPTVIKSFRAPDTETSFAYSTAALGAIITILTIEGWNFATYSFPILILATNLLIYSLIKFEIGERFGLKTT